MNEELLAALKLLEKIGIKIVEDALPELIAEAKTQGLAIINDVITESEIKLAKLKILQHLATVGHGKLIDDIAIAAVEGEISLLKTAAGMLI